jgi:prolyl-tRNA synthetase
MADAKDNKNNGADSEKKELKDIGITVKKDDDFSEWYQQAIIKSGMIDYGPVSGCMIIREDAYSIWEKIQDFFNKEIRKLGVKNAYFPMLIPERLLNREQEHVEGFTPEVAWVTKAGDSDLDEKLAIRPTSETIMYDSYSKWIRSWRDLPLKLNQWNNIVRWEFKHPVPLLRTREFLWQEGHTVFATGGEAEEEVYQILDIYRKVFEELYAVPMLKGIKSKSEKFAGAVYTTSVETIFPNGKAIQGATSHFLGQNFSKAFGIRFLNKEGDTDFGWQNSWGISTRSIGMMLGIHGDDKGLIIPPKVAPLQVVIVPILFDDTMERVLSKCAELKEELSSHHISVLVDERTNKPGWKYNYWELRGVPLRIELGPKDLEKRQIVMARRDEGTKETVMIIDALGRCQELLKDIQHNLLSKAKKFLDDSIIETDDYEQFEKLIGQKKIVLAFFCDNPECEGNIKDKTGAKTLNSPLNQHKKDIEGRKCFACGSDAHAKFYFGKSY